MTLHLTLSIFSPILNRVFVSNNCSYQKKIMRNGSTFLGLVLWLKRATL